MWVCASTLMPLSVRGCAPIKTPSDEHDTGDVEKEQAAQPRFHLPPFKLQLWHEKSSHVHVCHACDFVRNIVTYLMLLIVRVILLLILECFIKKHLFDVFVWVSVMLWTELEAALVT